MRLEEEFVAAWQQTRTIEEDVCNAGTNSNLLATRLLLAISCYFIPHAKMKRREDSDGCLQDFSTIPEVSVYLTAENCNFLLYWHACIVYLVEALTVPEPCGAVERLSASEPSFIKFVCYLFILMGGVEFGTVSLCLESKPRTGTGYNHQWDLSRFGWQKKKKNRVRV